MSIREYRALEAGTRSPYFETRDRIYKPSGWPQTFVGGAMTDAEITAAFSEILSDGRRVLRKYLSADEHGRKGLLLGLYREGSPAARAMAELVEVLDVDADARRRVTRILGEIEAATT